MSILRNTHGGRGERLAAYATRLAGLVFYHDMPYDRIILKPVDRHIFAVAG